MLKCVNVIERFNVAVTRAKALLIVVGNPHVLVKDDNWNKWVHTQVYPILILVLYVMQIVDQYQTRSYFFKTSLQAWVFATVLLNWTYLCL